MVDIRDIRDMDWDWYWLGYSMGVNSRKRIKEMPDRITNMGKQGVITIPTEQQKTSFFVGLMIGRMKIINNLDIIDTLTTIGKKGLSTADMLTLAVQEVEGVRGSYVDIPVFINKNAAENRGVAGFQLKLSYNKDYLDLVSITKSEFWTGSFTSDTSTQGLILAQGVKEVAERKDFAICYIRFYVKETVPSGVSEVPLRLEGRVGTGQGSELLTLINDELYYITPIKLEDGAVLLEATQGESQPDGEQTYPGPVAPVGPGSELNYELEIDMDYPPGVIPTGAIYTVIVIYIKGEKVGEVKIPLIQGSHKYKGKIPLQLPDLKTGKITYGVRIEPEFPEDEGLFYVFIKAGALFILEAVVPREETGEIPLEPFNRVVIDRMKITDFVVFEKFKQSGGGPVDLVIIDSIGFIIDSETITLHKQISNTTTDTMKITDISTVDKFKEKGSKSEDSMKITDIVIFTKSK